MGACKAPAGARVIQGAPVGAPWGPHGAPCWFQNVVRGLPGPYWSPLGGGPPWESHGGPYGREVPRARALLGMMRPAPHRSQDDASPAFCVSYQVMLRCPYLKSQLENWMGCRATHFETMEKIEQALRDLKDDKSVEKAIEIALQVAEWERKTMPCSTASIREFLRSKADEVALATIPKANNVSTAAWHATDEATKLLQSEFGSARKLFNAVTSFGLEDRRPIMGKRTSQTPIELTMACS